MTRRSAERADVIVVGAGSAGCALAARLSSDPTCSVLIIEAGAHYKRLSDYPPDLRWGNSIAAAAPGHPNNWTLTGHLMGERVLPISGGRVVGGSSAINGAQFVRGTKDDFDHWRALGNDAWAWEHVLPVYIRIERDLDLDGPLHSKAGPIPLRRPTAAELTPVARAFMDACRAAGFPTSEDKNGSEWLGVGLVPLNSVDGIRVNQAMTHIAPNLRRPNLVVRANARARRVLFEGHRAVGVETEVAGRSVVYRADEIVLTAGAIHSPALLMLSGVGPADELRRVGIPVVADSRGVGKNVMDHPQCRVAYRAHNGEEDSDAAPLFPVALNFTATDSDVVGDLEIIAAALPLDGADANSTQLSRRDGVRPISDLLLLCHLQFERSRGKIMLSSSDPTVEPTLSYNYLSDASDLARLRECVRVASALLRDPAYVSLGAILRSPKDTDLSSDESLNRWIHSNLTTAFHTACSCRMGPESDPDAVVDQCGRVYGTEGLWVADASIMPTLVRRGAHATAVMIGDRIADFF